MENTNGKNFSISSLMTPENESLFENAIQVDFENIQDGTYRYWTFLNFLLLLPFMNHDDFSLFSKSGDDNFLER